MGFEIIISGCKKCPLYFYQIEYNFSIRSLCKHPRSGINKIEREYDGVDKAIVPVTPKNCPLNIEPITLKSEIRKNPPQRKKSKR